VRKVFLKIYDKVFLKIKVLLKKLAMGIQIIKVNFLKIYDAVHFLPNAQ